MDLLLPQYTANKDKKFSNFDTREIGRRQYMMLDDFTYFDEQYGPITVPKGFVTNYASLDALRNLVLFQVYALLADYGDKSSTVHDWLYTAGTITINGQQVRATREQADEIFYRALRSEGIARWRAGMFFYGVRIGGASSYLE